MVQSIALLKRESGLSPEGFHKRHEEVHSPLAKRILPLTRRSLRHYVAAGRFSPAGEEPEFGGITEEWFDSMEASQTMLDIHQGETGISIREDEKEFLDMTKLQYLFVEEVT